MLRFFLPSISLAVITVGPAPQVLTWSHRCHLLLVPHLLVGRETAHNHWSGSKIWWWWIGGIEAVVNYPPLPPKNVPPFCIFPSPTSPFPPFLASFVFAEKCSSNRSGQVFRSRIGNRNTSVSSGCRGQFCLANFWARMYKFWQVFFATHVLIVCLFARTLPFRILWTFLTCVKVPPWKN